MAHVMSKGLSVGLVWVMITMAGCASTTPLPAPAPVASVQGLEATAVGRWPLPLRNAGGALAPTTLPLAYARGVDEEVEWPGTGGGEVVLTNAFGQQIYRLKQGAPAQRHLVPAGLYTLTFSPGTGRSVQEPWLWMDTTDGAGTLTRTFDQTSVPRSDVPSDPAQAAAYWAMAHIMSYFIRTNPPQAMMFGFLMNGLQDPALSCYNLGRFVRIMMTMRESFTDARDYELEAIDRYLAEANAKLKPCP